MNLQAHRLALLFPEIPPDEFQAMVADIKAGGLLEPIWLYEGKVLDGWHRYKAAKKAGIVPKTREWRGKDPLTFVVSMNVMRRHLDAGQRALLRVKAAEQAGALAHGKDWAKDQRPVGAGQERAAIARDADLAKQINVGERTITRARAVMGEPELEKAVLGGKVSLADADYIAKQVSKETNPKRREASIRRHVEAFRRPREEDRPVRATSKYVGPKRWEDTPSVAKAIQAIKAMGVATVTRQVIEIAELGKPSPEAGRYIAKLLRDEAKLLNDAAIRVERMSK
jgi:hypothetical protein